MSTLEIILIGALALENIILVICLMAKRLRNKSGIKVKDGVRYTTTSTISTDEKAVNISFNEKDVVLIADKVYIVGKDAEVKPGKYTILSTQEGKEFLTMRINDVCRNQKHGAEVVFAEGDIITAVNEPILLR